MKTPARLALALASMAMVQAQTSAPTTTPTAPKAVPVPAKAAPASKAAVVAPKSAAPAAKGAATKGKDGAKKEEPPKIEGVVVARGKNFLGVQIVNGTFKLSFYDDKKKPMPPDVPRAVLRWDPKYKVGKERVVLTAGEDGKSLSSPRTIRPPYTFKLYITLLKDATEAEDPVGETFVIDFNA